jgi:type VI secretion system Hcp family effector
MAENIGLMVANGTTQGVLAATENTRVDGDLTFKSGVEIHAYTTGGTTATDPSRLVVTGRPNHQVFTCNKPIDSTSPKFFQAWSTGEVFKTVTITFNKITPAGKPAKFVQYVLTNAVLVSWNQGSGTAAGTSSVSSTLSIDFLETCSFTFDSISHTFVPGNTMAQASVTGAKTS